MNLLGSFVQRITRSMSLAEHGTYSVDKYVIPGGDPENRLELNGSASPPTRIRCLLIIIVHGWMRLCYAVWLIKYTIVNILV